MAPKACNQLRGAYRNAEGISETVISIVLDIRGFSTFCQKVESTDVALYLKRFVLSVSGQYFRDASFAKATGDGLLIVVPYKERTYEKKAASVVEDSFRLLREFPTICEGDVIVNFATPNKLGIGIARGSVSKITCRGNIIDYAGRVLNLSARLMDLARPAGIVLEASFGVIPEEYMPLLTKKAVYLKGIAESSPVEVLYTGDSVVIPPFHASPLEHEEFLEQNSTTTMDEMRASGSFIYTLATSIADRDDVFVYLLYPFYADASKKADGHKRMTVQKVRVTKEAGRVHTYVELDEVVKVLNLAHVKATDKLQLTVRYRKRL